MSKDIRFMIDKINKLKINENIDNNLKSDLELIFKNNPDLNNIGTIEQYSEYIKTVFPNTKVKDILYHASPKKFTKFNKPSGFAHIYFSEKPLDYMYGGNLYIVKVDIRNPLIETRTDDYHNKFRSYDTPLNPDWGDRYHQTGELPKFEYDGTIQRSRVTSGNTITVREPDQIHILGSDEDIKGFENFTKRNISKSL
jgi:hypothetical protein